LKTKLLVLVTMSALLVLLTGIGCAKPAPSPTPAAGPEFEWKFQCAYPVSDCAYYVTSVESAELIEAGSRGRIEVKAFPEGELVASDQMIDAIMSGAVEGGVMMPAEMAGILPAALTLQLPTSAENIDELMELCYDYGLMDLLRPAFAEHNLYLMSRPYCGILTFQSTFPVHHLTDFKGKKIWANNTLVDGFKHFGAVPTFVPGFDMYTALKLGTLDGLSWTVGELEYAKFKEVVKYNLDLVLALAGDMVVINLDAWNALGPDLQKQVQDYYDSHLKKLGEHYAYYDMTSLAAAKEYGVVWTTLPDDEGKEFFSVQRRFWDQLATKSSLAAKAVEICWDFVKAKGRA